MKTYAYTAWDSAGACKQGVKTAESKEQALTLLRQEQLTPVSLEETTASPKRKNIPSAGRRVKSQDLSAFCWQLATMLGGGLPIISAITTIADEMPNRTFEAALKDIAVRLERGESLADSIAVYEKIFGRLGCAMIAAGDSSGSLTATLERLAEHYDNRDKLVRKVRGALAYPLFVTGFIVLIVTVMMTLIIPRFSLMLDELGDDMPAFTRGFMAVYETLMRNMPFLLTGLVVAAVAVFLYSRTPSGNTRLCRLTLRTPVFGSIIKMAFVATFCRTLGTLVASGVSIIDAFTILAGMTNNDILRRGVLDTRDRLTKGVNISQSMEMSGFFPGVAVKMVRIGEESGSLSDVLEKTSEYYARKVDLLIGSLLSLLEPILIVSVGAIVLVVLLAMYMPLFSMSAS